jgi:hypothetical protein
MKLSQYISSGIYTNNQIYYQRIKKNQKYE